MNSEQVKKAAFQRSPVADLPSEDYAHSTTLHTGPVKTHTTDTKGSAKRLNYTSLVCGILMVLWVLAIVIGAIRGH